MLNKDAVFNAKDVGRDPVNRRTKTRKPAMHDDEVSVRDNRPRFVFQRGRHSFDEVEQAVTSRLNMRAVLDIVWRPIPFGRIVIPLVKQHFEGVEYQRASVAYVRATLAPSAASRFAIAAPMPREPPVTIATFLVNLCMESPLLSVNDSELTDPSVCYFDVPSLQADLTL
jgi:hypothetical protein